MPMIWEASIWPKGRAAVETAEERMAAMMSDALQLG